MTFATRRRELRKQIETEGPEEVAVQPETKDENVDQELRDQQNAQDLTIQENLAEQATKRLKLDQETASLIIRCPQCDLVFDNSTNFKNHRSSHAKFPRMFKCTKCPKAYTRKQGLVYHENTIHSNGHDSTETRVFHCTGHRCSKTFPTRAERDEHQRTDHDIINGKPTDTSIYHNRPTVFKCSVCEKTFAFLRDHTRHMRTHSDERPFKCSVCEKAFKQRAHLTTHTRRHTGDRPFKCAECPATFIQQHSLTVHMRTHTGEKPFLCDFCGKLFASSAMLKTHVFMTHPKN